MISPINMANLVNLPRADFLLHEVAKTTRLTSENLYAWIYFTLCLTVVKHATICKGVSQNVWNFKR